MNRLARGKEIYINIKEFDEFIKKLKEWCNEEHIRYDGHGAGDCDFECWGKTFPRYIDKLAGEFRGKK